MRKTIQGLLGFTIAISTIGVFGQVIDLPTSKQNCPTGAWQSAAIE